jgi:hypothetical protein
MRRYVGGIGCGARGRDQTQVTLPGRRRAPPEGTRTPREELADGVAFRKPWPKARPEPETAAMEHREARTLSQRVPTPQGVETKRMRRSALRPLVLREGQEEGPLQAGRDDGLPGAGQEYGR